MDNVEKLSITLTAEQAKLVRGAVKSGEFATTSEVIRDALRDWQFRRRLETEQITEYRKLWEEGIKGPFSDGPTAMRRVEKHLKSVIAARKPRRAKKP